MSQTSFNLAQTFIKLGICVYSIFIPPLLYHHLFDLLFDYAFSHQPKPAPPLSPEFLGRELFSVILEQQYFCYTFASHLLGLCAIFQYNNRPWRELTSFELDCMPDNGPSVEGAHKIEHYAHDISSTWLNC